MADEIDPEEEDPPKKSKKPLMVGILLAVLGGAGGFFAVQMGLIGGSEKSDMLAEEKMISPMPEVAFVALDPMVISLPGGNVRTYLRFTAHLEVLPRYYEEVESIKPRIVDVLNGYLRAVKIADLEDPTALIRLRSQILRRIQVVAGEGRVRDLLIIEFVMS